jgi:hypothetical protein
VLFEGHKPGKVEFFTAMQLIKATEKRTERRHACEASIEWTHLNRITINYSPEISYRARVLNFSKSGMYFETDYPLKPGMTILFRIEKSRCKASNLEDCECLRTISLADVKWCRDLVKKGESYVGIGARYPTPY